MAVASNSFCTPNDVIGMYGAAAQIPPTSIEPVIDAVSAIMRRRLGRDVSYDAAWVEDLKCRGVYRIRLSRPLTTLTSAVRLNLDGTTAETLTNSDIITEDDGSDTGFAVLRHATGWNNTAVVAPIGARYRAPKHLLPLLRITYAGGWVTPREDQEAQASQSQTLPADLKLGCVAAVVENLRNFNLSDRSRGDGNVMYGSAPRTFLPQRVEDMLKGYALRSELSR